jgi:hypothetical protein
VVIIKTLMDGTKDEMSWTKYDRTVLEQVHGEENVRTGQDKKVKDIMKTGYNIAGRVTYRRQNTYTGQGQQVAITKTGCGEKGLTDPHI